MHVGHLIDLRRRLWVIIVRRPGDRFLSPDSPAGVPPIIHVTSGWWARSAESTCSILRTTYLIVNIDRDAHERRISLIVCKGNRPRNTDEMISNKHLLLLGTHDTHIHAIIFDSEARTLTRGASTVASEQPSWLARHPDS